MLMNYLQVLGIVCSFKRLVLLSLERKQTPTEIALSSLTGEDMEGCNEDKLLE